MALIPMCAFERSEKGMDFKMKKFSTWMVLCLDVIFWILRIVAAYTASMGMEFMIKPIDMNTEILLIFVALLSFILIAKRKFLGAIIYIIGYWGYFGVSLWKNIVQMQTVGGMINDYMSVFFSFIGVILPIATLLELLLDKNRQSHYKDQKTDWYYADKQYDMQKDDRDDKNNYRTL